MDLFECVLCTSILHLYLRSPIRMYAQDKLYAESLYIGMG